MPCRRPLYARALIWISPLSMKRKPSCMGGMSTRRKKKCSDWGNVWDATGASAFPTCARRRCLPRGMERASRPSATCAKAAGLAADLGLPGERWQIQAALGRVYEAAGDPVQARTAFGEAVRIIGELAEGRTEETLRARFLAGPPIQQVLQQAHRLATQVPQDQAKQSGVPRRLVLQTDELWEAS